MRTPRCLVIGSALLLAGCAPAASGPGGGGAPASIIPTSTGLLVRLADDTGGYRGVLDADSAAVSRALPEVYDVLGIPAGLLDARAGTYGTNRFTGPRIGDRRTASFVRCAGTGSGPTSTGSYRVRLAISSHVRAQPDGRSALVTSVAGLGTTVEGTSTAPIRCVSTDELEELIASLAQRFATAR